MNRFRKIKRCKLKKSKMIKKKKMWKKFNKNKLKTQSKNPNNL